MIIDATNLIVGRMATYVAKQALLGEKIDIINSDKAVYSGNKDQIMAKFKQKRNLGAPLVGPYIHRKADRILRRSIRGMLPYKQSKGSDAYKRIMCYVGIPPEFEGKETKTVEEANVSKLPTVKYVTVGDVSKYLGGKQ